MQAINDLIKLTQDKKVNKDNAFDIALTDTIGIENMRSFFSHNEKNETKWPRAGEALAAGAKIYGYRVDNVHQDAYKMMGSFARNKNGEVEIQLVGNEDE